jgi:hypothetical protein
MLNLKQLPLLGGGDMYVNPEQVVSLRAVAGGTLLSMTGPRHEDHCIITMDPLDLVECLTQPGGVSMSVRELEERRAARLGMTR